MGPSIGRPPQPRPTAPEGPQPGTPLPWQTPARVLQGARAALLALVLLSLLLCFLPSHAMAASPRALPHGAPGGPSFALPSLDLAHLLSPGALSPASGVSASVAIASFDPNVADNYGVSTTNLAPGNPSLSGSQALYLGVADALGPSAAVSAGIVEVNYQGSIYAAPVVVLPDGQSIYSQNNLINPGQAYTFSIEHEHGWWWTATCDGAAIVDGGGGNGSYDLGFSVAEGLTGSTTTLAAPAAFAMELGSTTLPWMPAFSASWALGIDTTGSGQASYDPVNASAFESDLSNPIGIAGHWQNAALPTDQVLGGGNIGFPGTGALLWGTANLHGMPRAAVYAPEAAFANATWGIGFNVTVPNFWPASGQQALLEASLPLNASITISLGLAESLDPSGALQIVPYYGIDQNGAYTTYQASSMRLAPGNPALFRGVETSYGWWAFSVNGAPILAATGNGTLWVPLPYAVSLLGPSASPFGSTFFSSPVPTFGVYGNFAAAGNFTVATPLLLATGPGPTWTVPDYALAWSWSAGLNVEGAAQDPGVGWGAVEFGTPLAPVASGLPVWLGPLQASLAGPTSLVAGETVVYNATLRSGFAPPSQAGWTANSTGGPAGTFSAFTPGTSLGTYRVNFTAPPVSTPTFEQLHVQVSSPDYASASSAPLGVRILPGTADQVLLSTRALPSTVPAGNLSTLLLWANASWGGPITDAQIVVTGAPNGTLGKVVAFGPGLYELGFTPPASLNTTLVYSLHVEVFAPGFTSVSTMLTITGVGHAPVAPPPTASSVVVPWWDQVGAWLLALLSPLGILVLACFASFLALLRSARVHQRRQREERRSAARSPEDSTWAANYGEPVYGGPPVPCPGFDPSAVAGAPRAYAGDDPYGSLPTDPNGAAYYEGPPTLPPLVCDPRPEDQVAPSPW